MTISEEICKICGLEPIKEIGMGGKCVKYIYPDFMNPDNFVKLMELKFNEINTIGWFVGACITKFNYHWFDRDTFFEQLLNIISVNQQDTHYIKQAIKQEEWRYYE